MSERRHYIDWLRVLAVLLLFPFHAGRVFNLGEPFYVKAVPESFPIAVALTFIDTWHMPLLFLLAGASTVFALRKRTPGDYAKERALRLGIPLLFGLAVITPVQGWVGARSNAAYAGSFVQYLASGRFLDMSQLLARGDYWGGFVVGHLWFILFLFVISMITLPMLAWSRTERGGVRLRRWSKRLANPAWWLLVAVILFITEGLPEIGGKNLLWYLTWFVLGFVALQDPSFEDRALRAWPIALPFGSTVLAAFIASVSWRDSLLDPSVPLSVVNIAGMLGAWMTVVGILGAGRALLDRPSPALTYLAEASYPLYLLHQTVIVVLAPWIVTVAAGTWVRYPVLVAASVAVTFALYEGIRRVGLLRFLFGMRPAVRTSAG